jgi:dipeptidyl aminopeptidase/acylaminoacyl peptidase
MELEVILRCPKRIGRRSASGDRIAGMTRQPAADGSGFARSRQVTTAPHGHMLTNTGVWSPDGRWIVYDVRSTADGAVFDGTRIERVEVETGRVELLYESRDGACCGVVTASPVDDRVVFILGPKRPDAEWSYGPARRRGVVVRTSRPGEAASLDARDLAAPFTPGALRGGTHVHVFSPDARIVSFTYEDAVLDAAPAGAAERNLRGVGVTVLDAPVTVPPTHPRNHSGHLSVLVTRLVDEPRPGSDEICRAFEEAWVGVDGYRRQDGSWQRRALAFQGRVAAADGTPVDEVFIVDLPDDPRRLLEPGDLPLAGTPTTRPSPPATVTQRRLTFTTHRRHPGIQGPRHWLRSSPDGTRIAYLARADDGVVQIFTVSPTGGGPTQLTHGTPGIASSFTWSPDGRWIACVADGSVCRVDTSDGSLDRLTPPLRDDSTPRPEACVFSPEGTRIACVRRVPDQAGQVHNQIVAVDVP